MAAGKPIIEIGDNVGISGATIYARKKITIGENTCIGGNCKILDNDFHPIEAEARNKLLRDENGGDSDLVPSREIKIDGPEGKIFHFLQAYWYRFLVDAKIYECEKKGITMKPQGDLKA